MPVLAGSAYGTVENVLNLARTIINDSMVAGGDILTDDYAGAFSLLNIAYNTIGIRLRNAGVDVFTSYSWLLNIPLVPSTDPEARVIITDTGYQIIYPDPANVNNSSGATPLLPSDMIVPLKLWERQNGTTNLSPPMKQPNDGIQSRSQQSYLVQWEWGSYAGSNDCLILLGALQAQDIKLKYKKKLAALAATTDPLPIRGVDNAAAYEAAKVFVTGRGGSVAIGLAAEGEDEIYQLMNEAAQRNQRKRSRRQPYSGGRSASRGYRN